VECCWAKVAKANARENAILNRKLKGDLMGDPTSFGIQVLAVATSAAWTEAYPFDF
jgi:hypothetical protein